jgi:hypothetical protein
MKIRFLSIAFFISCLAVSATAQTSTDLQAKYGQAFESFFVRPNILMTVQYTIDGQILEAVIEPNHMQKKGDNKSLGVLSNSEMLPETATEIIEEIAPLSKRGQRRNELFLSSSYCGSVSMEIYESVEIYLYYACSTIYKGNRVISAAMVRWKK